MNEHDATRGPIYRALVRADRWVETNPVMRLLAIAGAVVTFAATTFAAFGVLHELNQMDADRIVRQEEHLERQRDRLFEPRGGDTGKAIQFNALMRQQMLGDTIDLSCRSVGIHDGKHCHSAPVFVGLRLPPPDRSPKYPPDVSPHVIIPEPVWIGPIHDRPRNLRINLSGAAIGDTDLAGRFVNLQLVGAIAHNVDMGHAHITGDFSDATMNASSLAGTYLGGKFERLEVRDSAFWGSVISGELNGLHVRSSNISGTHFVSMTTTDQGEALHPRITFDKVWFWADRPPRFYYWARSDEVSAPDRLLAMDAVEAFSGLDSALICRPPGEDRREQDMLPVDAADPGRESYFPVACEPMSIESARATFYPRWNSVFVCQDHWEQQFLRRTRTAPPEVCALVEE